MADEYEDREIGWLTGLADAVAREMGISRETSFAVLASVFGNAANDGGPFTLPTIAELERAGRLCERLAALPAGVTS